MVIPIPDELKQRVLNSIVDFLVNQAETRGSDQVAKAIRHLSSQAEFNKAFDKAMERGIRVFQDRYTTRDEDLVMAITTDGKFWESRDVRQALLALIRRPGASLQDERGIVVQHFANVLPDRINRDRVDRAITYVLGCVVEELWTLPGAKEIREIYSLQFQKIGAEAVQQQVKLLEAQLQATTQLSVDVRQGLLQLAMILEQHLLAAPAQLALPSPRPYHNLPRPDYTNFVGRSRELSWLRQRLLASDRAWQIAIVGMGGVGKSALALAISHEYHENYKDLPPEERFEAIIWISAKEQVLTIRGREKSKLPGLIFRTLEEMYTTIAQTLEREDITRATPEERDHLVQKALKAQRTLLIVDNLESVNDERVRAFLRDLPAPTKCIITSREWVDTSDIWRLTGMIADEAKEMITEEATTRNVILNEEQRVRLFNRTSGLPLPIKLSIARMASGETFDQVMRWLGNVTGDLPAYAVVGQIDTARQRDPHTGKLLLACSLFDRDAGASREALGFVADLSLSDRDEGLTTLQQLSLVSHAGDDRFWMLPMIQEHVRNALAGTEPGEMLTKRWLSWLLEFTQKYGVNLNLYVESASKISSEYFNVLGAIRWCHEHERWQPLIRLTRGIWSYSYLVGLFSELQEILEAAIEASEVLRDEQEKGIFLRLLGQLFRVQGQNEKSLDYLERAEEIASRYKNDAELGRIHCIRLIILSHQNRLFEAEQLAESVLEMGKRLNDLELNILVVHRLSEIESKRCQFDKALAWLDQGEQWARELASSREMAWNMYRRGSILIHQGKARDAESFLTQSLNMSTSWSEHRLIALNKHKLAQVYLDRAQVQLAIQMGEAACDLYERLGMTMELTELENLLQPLIGPDPATL